MEYCMVNPSGNNEHKFATSLDAYPVTTITPQNAIKGSVMVITKSSTVPQQWNGWVFGNSGLQVNFSLFKISGWTCEGTEEILACRIASVNLTLAGNTTPVCWNVSSFSLCEEPDVNEFENGDVVVMTATIVASEEEGQSFSLTSGFRVGV